MNPSHSSHHPVAALLGLAGLLAAAPVSAQIVTSLVSSNDTFLRNDRSYTVNGVTDNMDFRLDFTSYFQFDMSSLAIDEILGATLTLHKLAKERNDTMVADRVEVYGLPTLAGNTEQNWHETAGGWQTRVPERNHGLDFRNVGNDWLSGTGAVAAQLVNLDARTGANVTESVSGGTVYTLTGPDLISFLSTRASDGGLVTFVVENPVSPQGWGWATKDHADSALHPTLTLTFTEGLTLIPEPSVLTLLLGSLGLLAIVGRRRR
jgi:hypothetical protein